MIELKPGWLLRDVQRAVKRVKEMGWDIEWVRCDFCGQPRDADKEHRCPPRNRIAQGVTDGNE